MSARTERRSAALERQRTELETMRQEYREEFGDEMADTLDASLAEAQKFLDDRFPKPISVEGGENQ